MDPWPIECAQGKTIWVLGVPHDNGFFLARSVDPPFNQFYATLDDARVAVREMEKESMEKESMGKESRADSPYWHAIKAHARGQAAQMQYALDAEQLAALAERIEKLEKLERIPGWLTQDLIGRIEKIEVLHGTVENTAAAETDETPMKAAIRRQTEIGSEWLRRLNNEAARAIYEEPATGISEVKPIVVDYEHIKKRLAALAERVEQLEGETSNLKAFRRLVTENAKELYALGCRIEKLENEIMLGPPTTDLPAISLRGWIGNLKGRIEKLEDNHLETTPATLSEAYLQSLCVMVKQVAHRELEVLVERIGFLETEAASDLKRIKKLEEADRMQDDLAARMVGVETKLSQDEFLPHERRP